MKIKKVVSKITVLSEIENRGFPKMHVFLLEPKRRQRYMRKCVISSIDAVNYV
jgi:hypothetical protein